MRYQFYNHLQYLPTTICAIINTFIFDSPRPQSCCSSYNSFLVGPILKLLTSPDRPTLLSHQDNPAIPLCSPTLKALSSDQVHRMFVHFTYITSLLQLLQRLVASSSTTRQSCCASFLRSQFGASLSWPRLLVGCLLLQLRHTPGRGRGRQAVYQSEPARARGLYYLCRRLRQISSLTAALSIGRQQLASRRKFAGYFKDHDHPGIRIKINSGN